MIQVVYRFQNQRRPLDLKIDLANFRTDINLKLNKTTTDLKDMIGRLEKAEQRLMDLKEWSTEFKEVLCQALDIQDRY